MITITQETMDRISTILEEVPRGTERAVSNAINRALTTAKSESYKGVTKEYAITRKVIAEYTKESITKASSGDMCGTVTFSGQQIPLYKYKPTRVNTKGVIAGQKTGKAITNAFIKNMTSGHRGIFERVSKKRLPIQEIMGSSMRSMVSNAVVIEEVYKKSQETLDKRIEQEISRLLAGYGG